MRRQEDDTTSAAGAGVARARHISCWWPPDMTLDFKRARQLCTQAELALVASARPQELRSLTPKRLDGKIARARGLRDKFRDKASQQAREARGKAAPRRTRRARGNVRTVEKAELFGEVLRRFEVQASKLDQNSESRASPRTTLGTARASGAAARAGASPRAPTARRVRATPSIATFPPRRRRSLDRKLRRKSDAAIAARKQVKFATSQGPRVRAHVASRNRRQQARRDSR